MPQGVRKQKSWVVAVTAGEKKSQKIKPVKIINTAQNPKVIPKDTKKTGVDEEKKNIEKKPVGQPEKDKAKETNPAIQKEIITLPEQKESPKQLSPALLPQKSPVQLSPALRSQSSPSDLNTNTDGEEKKTDTDNKSNKIRRYSFNCLLNMAPDNRQIPRSLYQFLDKYGINAFGRKKSQPTHESRHSLPARMDHANVNEKISLNDLHQFVSQKKIDEAISMRQLAVFSRDKKNRKDKVSTHRAIPCSPCWFSISIFGWLSSSLTSHLSSEQRFWLSSNFSSQWSS